MSTVTVVRKNGVAALAADTTTKWGATKESAAYIVNHSKILKVGAAYIGFTGPTAVKQAVFDHFGSQKKAPALDSVPAIYKAWRDLHAALKETYSLRPDEDEADSVESSRVDVVIASPGGIFGVSAHRVVQEFSRFYSFGSGCEFATGALFALYDDPAWDAERLARRGVEAAAEFNDATGLPIESFTVALP